MELLDLEAEAMTTATPLPDVFRFALLYARRLAQTLGDMDTPPYRHSQPKRGQQRERNGIYETRDGKP